MNPERTPLYVSIQAEVQANSLIQHSRLTFTDGTSAEQVLIPASQYKLFQENKEFTCYFNSGWYIVTPDTTNGTLTYSYRTNYVANGAIGQLKF